MHFDWEFHFGRPGFELDENHDIVAYSGNWDDGGERCRILLRMRMSRVEGTPPEDIEVGIPDVGNVEELPSGRIDGFGEIGVIQPVNDGVDEDAFVADVFVRAGYKLNMVAVLETPEFERIEDTNLGWTNPVSDLPNRTRLKWRPEREGGIELLWGTKAHVSLLKVAEGARWTPVKFEDPIRFGTKGWEVGKEKEILLFMGKRPRDGAVFRLTMKMIMEPADSDG